jgi:hypothetical protein
MKGRKEGRRGKSGEIDAKTWPVGRNIKESPMIE